MTAPRPVGSPAAREDHPSTTTPHPIEQETAMTTTTLDLDTLHLDNGSHGDRDHGVCVMEEFRMHGRDGTFLWAPAEDRLWSRLRHDETSGCREWMGSRDIEGYGSVKLSGRTTKAHRAAWVLTYGPIPDGMVVMHACDNPPCCNPQHLRLGTVAQNNADRAAKGRSKGVFRSEDHPRRLVDAELLTIARNLRAQGMTQQAIADRIGVSRGHVAHLTRGVLPRNTRGAVA